MGQSMIKLKFSCPAIAEELYAVEEDGLILVSRYGQNFFWKHLGIGDVRDPSSGIEEAPLVGYQKAIVG